MGCTFCATGQAGFTRQLTVGEVIEQVVHAARAAAPRRISNVVFMGMGEPLANYDVTVTTIRRLHECRGLSARSLTVSTVGVAPAIERLAREGLPLTLAISLHVANDAQRGRTDSTQQALSPRAAATSVRSVGSTRRRGD
jgi:23S rRNA (adenine2503-C2)-methyltransferase